MSDQPQETNELTKVEVLTVGLVTRGANKEEIFLTKADEGESDSPPTPTEGDVEKREFNQGQRDRMAESGAAMEDGSFPIANTEDLANAIHAIGRAKDPAKARAHIIARARALGMTDKLPEDWVKKDDSPEDSFAARFWTRIREVVRYEISKFGPVPKPEEEEDAEDKEEPAAEDAAPSGSQTTDEEPVPTDKPTAEAGPEEADDAEDDDKEKACAPRKEDAPLGDVETQPCAKSEPTATGVEKHQPDSSVEAHMAEDNEKVQLEKALNDLKDRLEKAEREAAQERELRERQVFVAKAATFANLPTKADELGDFLYWLTKTDTARGTYAEALLRAVDAQLQDGLFVEKGTSRSSEPDSATAKVEQIIKSGKSERDALLSVDNATAMAYIREQRKRVRES